MQSGQRIARLGVIELAHADGLPVFRIVALLASSAQPSLVRILVAGGAGRRKAEKGAAQVLILIVGRSCGGICVGVWQRVQATPCVLAFENVSGQLVIEGFDVPLDEREILAVVFGVAAGALLA